MTVIIATLALAGIPGSPAAFYHFLMDAAGVASRVATKK